MSDLRQASREFLVEFIELYKSLPCLWQIKSKDYSDRNKKDLAYAELVIKYKEIDPKADRAIIVKKINSFRTVYKKEVNKIKNSLKSGAGADDVYKPNLWYFELLHFLNDVEPPRNSKSTINENEEENMEQAGAVEEEMTLNEENQEHDTPPLNNPAPTASGIPFSRPASKRKLTLFEQASLETMQKVGKKLESYKEDDSLDRFGKHVADRLRDVKPHQLKIAQKLISDILFEADMESLNRFWKVTSPDEESYQASFPQLTNYRQDNSYQMQTQQNFHDQAFSPGQSSSASGNSVNLPPRQNTIFTTQQVVSPEQSSYTSESSVKEYVNLFNPNKI